MKRILSVLSFLFLCTLTTVCAKSKVGPKVICGPYVQCVTETGFTVLWVTDMDAICWVETAPDDGTHFYNLIKAKHTQHGKINEAVSYICLYICKH